MERNRAGQPQTVRVVGGGMGWFCTNCGSAIQPGAAFCTSCGASVDTATIPPVPKNDAHKTPDGVRSGKTVIIGATDTPAVPDSPRSQPKRVEVDVNSKRVDPTMLSQLMTLTPEEAETGCRKTLRTKDGREVEVVVPPHAGPQTKVDIAGYGLLDEKTGKCGPLRVTFYIAR